MIELSNGTQLRLEIENDEFHEPHDWDGAVKLYTHKRGNSTLGDEPSSYLLDEVMTSFPERTMDIVKALGMQDTWRDDYRDMRRHLLAGGVLTDWLKDGAEGRAIARRQVWYELIRDARLDLDEIATALEQFDDLMPMTGLEWDGRGAYRECSLASADVIAAPTDYKKCGTPITRLHKVLKGEVKTLLHEWNGEVSRYTLEASGAPCPACGQRPPFEVVDSLCGLVGEEDDVADQIRENINYPGLTDEQIEELIQQAMEERV